MIESRDFAEIKIWKYENIDFSVWRYARVYINISSLFLFFIKIFNNYIVIAICDVNNFLF